MKVLYVVNPNAGTKRNINFFDLISTTISNRFTYEIVIWENANNFGIIESKIQSREFTHVLSVGGDGTMNKVASSCLNNEIIFGIVPLGSGNGLARSLKIPLDIKKAIEFPLVGKTKQIDCGLVNGIPFFCTSGTGFDAHIGHLFNTVKKRGFWTYLKLVIKEFVRFKGQEINLELNGEQLKRRIFLCTAANAGQYGNDFYIAPNAKLDDGELHIVIVHLFPIIAAPIIALQILLRRANHSRYFETIMVKECKITSKSEIKFHYDGEPAFASNELKLSIKSKALNILCVNDC